MSRTAFVSVASLALLLTLAPPLHASQKKACSATTKAALQACKKAAQSDSATAVGICRNVGDKAAQRSCLAEAKSAMKDDLDSCREQRDARTDVCRSLGQAPYSPSFAPGDFDGDFSHLTHPNPLFPLGIGSQWTYVGGGETDHLEITSATKLIEGVTCIVAHDLVSVAGQKTEETNDWFAQAKNGDVYYCGEETGEYETFPGDVPPVPELVDTEGSFKAGRDGAQPGIVMLGSPVVGMLYREEFSLGAAEDLGEVLSTTYRYGQGGDLDQHVPQALAMLLCSGDCLVTREFTPLEPDADERKYYAPGIGDFLEIDLSTGAVTQLVDCNVDPRCGMLPAP
jgi:hypothetical protein